jgi:hypothetical protein
MHLKEGMDLIVYVVRHGETEWNSIDRQQGHLDRSLTDSGVLIPGVKLHTCMI